MTMSGVKSLSGYFKILKDQGPHFVLKFGGDIRAQLKGAIIHLGHEHDDA